MIERGLLQELKDFHADYNRQRLKEGQLADYTKGIFQSIGFKEFHQYLVLSEEEQQTEAGKKLYKAGVTSLKQVGSFVSLPLLTPLLLIIIISIFPFPLPPLSLAPPSLC